MICKHRYARFQDGKRRCVTCKEEFIPLPFVELVQALTANAEAADREDKPYTAAVYRSALIHIERGLSARTGLETFPVPGPMPSFQQFDCLKCANHKTTTYMILCQTCGNKRCPKASDHDLACTNSNEPGQPGSQYPALNR